MTTPIQATTFADGEGDAWYTRNRAHLAAYDMTNDPVARAITAAGLKPRSILDLGCSSGTRLTALCRHHRAQGTGVEPSAAAIEEARTRDPHVTWQVGTLDAHPPLQGPFDLVVVSFVLHWIDRRRLLTSLAALDAEVADGGCVVISDFYPEHPLRREYHHLTGQGVFTYKNDYPAMLLSTGLYRPLLRQTLDYPSFGPAQVGTSDGEQVDRKQADRKQADRAQVAVLERIPASAITLG